MTVMQRVTNLSRLKRRTPLRRNSLKGHALTPTVDAPPQRETTSSAAASDNRFWWYVVGSLTAVALLVVGFRLRVGEA